MMIGKLPAIETLDTLFSNSVYILVLAQRECRDGSTRAVGMCKSQPSPKRLALLLATLVIWADGKFPCVPRSQQT